MARFPRHFQLADNGAGQLVHCVSRVVERQFHFGDMEKEVFAKMMRRAEGFSGVRIVTWTILDNHFHILIYVVPPHNKPMCENEILDRVGKLYSRDELRGLRSQLDSIRENYCSKEKGDAVVLDFLQCYVTRMHNVSEFMKTIKQRFTMWFNRTHARVGTLWESRFKSVLVEGEHHSALKVAAYIDLNSVRAGIVNDPKNYRWSGYGEAVAGRSVAQRGLAYVLELAGDSGCWPETNNVYRELLFGIGEDRGVDEAGCPARKGISSEEVRKVQAAGGKLTLSELLRCRIRYFTDGLVIGSAEFVNTFYNERSECFGALRRTGARPMRGGEWDGMCAFRDLRKDLIT